jgi:hypothetical protein
MLRFRFSPCDIHMHGLHRTGCAVLLLLTWIPRRSSETPGSGRCSYGARGKDRRRAKPPPFLLVKKPRIFDPLPHPRTGALYPRDRMAIQIAGVEKGIDLRLLFFANTRNRATNVGRNHTLSNGPHWTNSIGCGAPTTAGQIHELSDFSEGHWLREDPQPSNILHPNLQIDV